MQSAAKLLTLTLGFVALADCHQSGTAANDQDMTIDDNVASAGLPPNAEIETLPPDESSVDSNGELTKGDDNPDVNDLGNGH